MDRFLEKKGIRLGVVRVRRTLRSSIGPRLARDTTSPNAKPHLHRSRIATVSPRTPTMEGELVESPRKRLKTDNAASPAGAAESTPAKEPADTQAVREAEVGITQFVSPENAGFSGIFKKR
jgi:hypothetical protein